jgi:ankyrin repeat protein
MLRFQMQTPYFAQGINLVAHITRETECLLGFSPATPDPDISSIMDYAASARWSTISSMPLRKKIGSSATVGKSDTPDAISTGPLTALHSAAQQGDEASVQSILNGSVADIDKRESKHGHTPLCRAAMNGHVHIIRILLAHGADPEVATVRLRSTPLLIAAERGHDLAVEALLLGGADVRAKTRGGWTALHQAAAKGHVVVVARLLEHDADLDAQGGRFSKTPLYSAASHGHDDIIKLLLDKGADPRTKTTEKLTAADAAAKKGHKNCEKLLLNRMGPVPFFARLAKDLTRRNAGAR